MTDWAQDVNPNHPWPEYPRPQMQRTNWLNLNGIWQFQAGHAGDPIPTNALSGDILVPFCMESAISGVMQHSERAWYQRSFTVPAAWAGQRILLHFEAVDWECEPFLNGTSLGIHQGGYDPFTYDITSCLKGTGPQTLTVRVYAPADNTGGQTFEPLGKQRLAPSGVFYTACSGIWQTVWLEPVPATSISDLHLVPDIDNHGVRLNVTASGPAGGVTVLARALAGTNVVATATGAPGADFFLSIPSPQLWSPTNPFLYTLQLALTNGGGELDSVASYFGMRKVSLGTNSGFVQMLLNNQFLFQIGPLDQGYWPDGIYTPPTDAAMRGDIQLIKQLGFNLIRKHMKVEPARYYYWADQLGVLIWQDMPAMLPGVPVASASQPIFEGELTRMVQTHWNAPSIIVWTIFNEGSGQYDTVRISRNVMALDPSRLVNCASGWTYYDVGHIQDSHAYPNPSCPQNATKAVVNGEFGGVGLVITNHTWAPGWGYVTVANGLDLTTRFEGFCEQLANFIRNQGLSAAVYTQTTDVETELNGLHTYDRKLRKAHLVRVQAAVNSLIGSGPLQTSIPVTNNSFELPSLAALGGDSFTNLAGIPGWTFPNAVPASTSGLKAIEPGRSSDLSSQALLLRSQDGPACQTTGHRIGTNEVYTLTLDCQNAGQSAGFQMQLYYEEGGNRVVFGGTNLCNVFDTNVTGSILQHFVLTAAATPASVGRLLGIQVANLTLGPTSAELFDNIGLTYIPVAPTVLQQPVGGTRYAGNSTTLTAVVAGQPPIQFQWQHNATNVPGGTNQTLRLPNLGPADSGDYILYATNAFGSTNSSTATLTVAVPTLIHRYGFATNGSDSVGGTAWQAVLHGHAVVSGGRLQLDGTSGTYAQLPAGILSNYDAVTLEAWVSFGTNGNWARLFDFGDEDGTGCGRNYILCTPHSGVSDSRISISDADPGYSHEQFEAVPSVLDGRTNVHVVAIFYPAAGLEALYLNGCLAAVNPSLTIPLSSVIDNFNFLGRSLYSGDAWLNASIDEFRIYQGALAPAQVALNYSAGPGNLLTNPGNLRAVRLVVNTNMAVLQTQQALLVADFDNVSNVNLFASANPGFASSAPNIISVTPAGLLTAQNPGSATIQIAFDNVIYSAPIQVATRPLGLKHRYSFRGDASDSVGGPAWDGTLRGQASVAGGRLVLNSALGSYVQLPSGILAGYSSVTIETWASFNTLTPWAALWAFGDHNPTSGCGRNYLTMIPHSGASPNDTRSSMADSDPGYNHEEAAAAAGTLDGQTNVHIVAIYNPGAGYEALFLNGTLAATYTNLDIPMSHINSLTNLIGHSLYDADPYLNGSIDEFRIYLGTLAPAEIAADYAGGPATLPFPLLHAELEGFNLRVSWPAWATRYSLYYSPTLGPGEVWTPVKTAPTEEGTNFTATLALASQTRFFRLSN